MEDHNFFVIIHIARTVEWISPNFLFEISAAASVVIFIFLT